MAGMRVYGCRREPAGSRIIRCAARTDDLVAGCTARNTFVVCLRVIGPHQEGSPQAVVSCSGPRLSRFVGHDERDVGASPVLAGRGVFRRWYRRRMIMASRASLAGC